MRRVLLAFGLLALMGTAAPAAAQLAPKVPAAAAEELFLPIAEANSLMRQALSDIEAGRMAQLAPLVPSLERALANPDAPKTIGDAPVFLIDGLADRLLVQMWLTTPEGRAAAARRPRLMNDPYPHIAYALGFYYNEINEPDQALRALDAGLKALNKHMDPNLPDSASLLRGEIAAAHNIAGRWPQAHDAYQTVLSLPDKSSHASAYRGMGFSLIEMNRLDEAEAAFKRSLELQPDSKAAKDELAYIAQLRAGGSKQAPQTTVEKLSPGR